MSPARKPAPPALPLVECLIEDRRWQALGIEALAETAARATLATLGLPCAGFSISLLAADDARIAVLNGDFRGKPVPTNVLSWPSQDRGATADGGRPAPPAPGTPDDPEELGDIALAYETCLREAAEAGLEPAAHLGHLVVHGVMHLLGYDHIRDKDAALMEDCEVRILASLGIEDPYGRADARHPG
ncbi:MAG: rRNA maturation RNase YbeY [Pararhodobacter sp.]|nr:rRNA maturation RNase YbeY [Pararhodobacter sp.]